MPGKGQKITPDALNIQWKMRRRLTGVNEVEDTALIADLSNRFNGRD